MSGLTLTDKAIRFAARAHRKQTRKASDTPYISHPYSVAMLLQKAGCEEELVAAGLLHDTLEDTETTEAELLALFGCRVLELVRGCSEPDKSLPWEERKHHTIETLKTASRDICLVTCADKLHNIRTLIEDHQELGDLLWERFNRGKEKQAWYYTSILAVLKVKLGNHPMVQALEEEISYLFNSN
ncbi:MAG TPA: HD domain-containing protein [Sporolactobacillaceae bacterium]|nr:HD domain-containing protein [Sporolactobacillaceae bacterium]